MIFSDKAINHIDADRLGRGPFAAALGQLLGDGGLDTPLSVGILGGWGVGKTSLMRMVQAQLDQRQGACCTLWFDAWLYARQEQSLWRALLLSLTGNLGQRAATLATTEDEREKLKAKLQELEESLYRSQTQQQRGDLKVNWGSALPLVADLALRAATVGLSDAAGDAEKGQGPIARFVATLKGEDAKEAAKLIERESREHYVAEVRSLEQFCTAFAQALTLAGIGGPQGRRLYLFIDDLDRCLPEDAVGALEAIKLFLDLPGCVFILGMDGDVVETGIRARYARYFADGQTPFRPGDYLDKIIQMPFRLPPLAPTQIEQFLTDLCNRDSSGLINDVKALVTQAVPDNPRTLKRVLNVLRLAATLDGSSGQPGSDTAIADRRRYLAKIVLMQVCFPDTYRRVASLGQKELRRLEGMAIGTVQGQDTDNVLLPAPLKAVLETRPHFGHIDATDITTMLALSASLSFAAGSSSGGGA